MGLPVPSNALVGLEGGAFFPQVGTTLLPFTYWRCRACVNTVLHLRTFKNLTFTIPPSPAFKTSQPLAATTTFLFLPSLFTSFAATTTSNLRMYKHLRLVYNTWNFSSSGSILALVRLQRPDAEDFQYQVFPAYDLHARPPP